jgi:hypothetical protein
MAIRYSVAKIKFTYTERPMDVPYKKAKNFFAMQSQKGDFLWKMKNF